MSGHRRNNHLATAVHAHAGQVLHFRSDGFLNYYECLVQSENSDY